MADYKELLRRAISALPENNGAARRAVYEKARSALVGQLRSIQPPLPAREITQHRLQLEDCIRQVEQEASEAVISLGRDAMFAPKPATATPPAPQTAEPEEAALAATPRPNSPEPRPAPAFVPPQQVERPAPQPVFVQPEPEPEPQPEAELEYIPEPAPEPEPIIEPVAAAADEDQLAQSPMDETLSIEEIISQAADNSGAQVQPATLPFELRPADRSAPKAEEPEFVPPPAAAPVPLKRPDFTPRRDTAAIGTSAAIGFAGTASAVARVEPSLGGSAALARQPVIEPDITVEAALSSVREVEIDQDEAKEAEGVIERAIETLDREARGEPTDALPERDVPLAANGDLADDNTDPSAFDAPESQRRQGAGLTIFLIVFALLLAGAGGAGFWAWREGYVDLDQMFGRAAAPVTQTADTPVATTPTLDAPGVNETTTGPGNTATTQTAEPTTAIDGTEDRLEPTPEAVTPNGTETTLPSLNGGETKTEERLSGADTSIAANDPANSVDPAVLAGSQSLLLEASSDGRTGAVPFSGTVDWAKGEDELGQPTLVGKASIPARALNVSVTIRKNTDPSLPASHLMEVNFDVSDTFVGGSISSLPGVLLKNEELVPGTPLVGASARIVGNSFLFALSSSPDDETANVNLLENRRWLDLAIVYGTGRNAILTLEKDSEADALFKEVFAAWAQ